MKSGEPTPDVGATGPERPLREIAMEAVARIRQRALELGLDKMTYEEIEEEIRQARAERAG